VGRNSWRLPLALAACVVAAEGAVLLLRPREDVIRPAPVSERSYFSAAELDRIHDFRDLQRWIGIGSLVAEGGVLVLLVRRPPRWVRRGGRRWALNAAAAGAGVAVVLAVVNLPFGIVARERAKDVGLVTQDWVGYAGDVVKGTAIQAVLFAAGAVLLVGMARRFPRNWWAPAAALVVGVGALFAYAGPVVLDPLFNTFTPASGRVRADVEELARRAGLDVGEVYVIDASKRTTAANAYVNGLGHTKRVVLYDTLLREFTPEQRRLVIAHELGHVHYHDVPRGLLWVALVAPFGMVVVQLLVRRWAPEQGTAAMVPAVALGLVLVGFGLQVAGNQLSRRVEARADSYALRLTGDGPGMVRFEQKIVRQNVSDPDPPALVQRLFGTHPPAIDRIGAAVAFSDPDRRGTPGGS
jgi:Zn-dependent protease with chaperone function